MQKMMNDFSSSFKGNVKWLLQRELDVSTPGGHKLVQLGPKYSQLARILTEKRPGIAQEYYGINFRDVVVCEKCAENVNKELNDYERDAEKELKKLWNEKLDENSVLSKKVPLLCPTVINHVSSSPRQRQREVGSKSGKRHSPDENYEKTASPPIYQLSQVATQEISVGQKAMRRRMVIERADDKQFCLSADDKTKTDQFGGNAGTKCDHLDPLSSINMENEVCYGCKAVKYQDEVQSHSSTGYVPVKTTETYSHVEASHDVNGSQERILFQTQNTPYITALESFSDWLYEWTPPERILPKLEMIGRMRNDIVRGWLMTVTMQRPLPLYRSKEIKTCQKKDASVQTDETLNETPRHSNHKFTRVKNWLHNRFKRSRRPAGKIPCTGVLKTKDKSQKDEAFEDPRCGYSTKDQMCSSQATVTMETLQASDLNAMTRSCEGNKRGDVAQNSNDIVETRENFPDFKNNSTYKNPVETPQNKIAAATANLRSLREIECPSLICVDRIATLTERDTKSKYWGSAFERTSPCNVGTVADENNERNERINHKIDLQSRTAHRLSYLSLLGEDKKMDDEISKERFEGRNIDKNVGIKQRNYSSDVVPELSRKGNVLPAKNKIISKVEKVRVKLLNMSSTLRSKIEELDASSLVYQEVKTTETTSLPLRLPTCLNSSEDIQKTKFGFKSRFGESISSTNSHSRPPLRERLSIKLGDSNKVHPEPFNTDLERRISETKTESLDQEELREMTEFIELTLQRQKEANLKLEVNNLLMRQRDLKERLKNPSAFLPYHRLELAFRETVRQKFAHHNHFQRDPPSKEPDPRQGCIGCQLLVSSELYGSP